MSRPVSRLAIVAAIVAKDLRAFAGDKLWLSITPLGLGSMIASFWILPGAVVETVSVGIVPPEMAAPIEALAHGEGDDPGGLEVIPFDDEPRMVAAIEGAGGADDPLLPELSVGLAFPRDFPAALRAGQRPTVTLYADTTVPAPLRGALAAEVRELVYGIEAAAAGVEPATRLPVRLPDEGTFVLGEDRAGDQVSLRERMQPMLALLVLMIGAIALGGLVAAEIEQRTVRALLVTPARVGDLLAGKGITGAILVLGQGLVFALATWSFGDRPLLVIVLLMLGALMLSAVGLLAGAAGRDFMSTMFFGLVLFTPLMIPTFSVLFPGSASAWVQLLPSYGLTRGLVETIGYGRGWLDVAPLLAATAGWTLALFAAAVVVLRRRLEAA